MLQKINNETRRSRSVCTCASSWIKCESFWFYGVLTVYARLGFSILYQTAKYIAAVCSISSITLSGWRPQKKNLKKNTGQTLAKLVLCFAAGTSKSWFIKSSKKYIGLPAFPSITKFKNCIYINSVYIVSRIKREIKKKKSSKKWKGLVNLSDY